MALGVPIGTIMSRLSRARAAMSAQHAARSFRSKLRKKTALMLNDDLIMRLSGRRTQTPNSRAEVEQRLAAADSGAAAAS